MKKKWVMTRTLGRRILRGKGAWNKIQKRLKVRVLLRTKVRVPRLLLLGIILWFVNARLILSAPWEAALSQMSLGHVTQLNRSNCVEVMLGAFQSNDAVKAIIFLPGATDEF